MHDELLATAWRIVRTVAPTAPTNTDLRRALSTGYYALFHYVSDNCATELIRNGPRPLTRAAAQIYRSLEHRDIAAACERAKSPKSGFPQPILIFCDAFLDALKARNRADYDPAAPFNLPHVEDHLRRIEAAMAAHASADAHDRRAFAILIAVKPPAKGRG